MNLSPLPIQRFYGNLGFPLIGGKLFTYLAGTNTKEATFQDSTGTLNSNPIILNFRGECRLWLDVTKTYKFVLAPATDTDPPTNPIWTVDNISAGVTYPELGPLFYPRTAAEVTAGVVPSSYFFPEGDLRRYGGVGNGSADDSIPFGKAVSVGRVFIPKNYSFKIVSGAGRTGAIVVYGEGPQSKLLCDSTVLTVTNGDNSVCDNFYMENLTAPWIITRDPTNWASPPYATLQQSNAVGYQPTVNDGDIWTAAVFTASQAAAGTTMVVTAVSSGSLTRGQTLSGTGIAAGTYIVKQLTGSAGSTGNYQVSNTTGFAATTVTTLALTSAQQNQNIGPTIVFTGVASNVSVSRIYGRFVRLEMLDCVRSIVRDCNFRGGKGSWGSINFDNATNNLQTGIYNKAINNTIQYASFNGIIFQNNSDCIAEGNSVDLCGESGIKPAGSGIRACLGALVIGNDCHRNYYDGIDLVTSFPTTDTTPAYHQCIGNYCYGNGGNGINIDGRFNSIIANKVSSNDRYGIWCITAYSQVNDNYAYDNNISRDASQHEILVNGINNIIVGNRIYSGAGANSSAIFVDAAKPCVIDANYAEGSSFFFGNPNAVASTVGPTNIDPSTGFETRVAFTIAITNTGGTMQHSMSDTGGGGTSYLLTRITGASAALTNTPTGNDATTAMAAGGKIGSANTNTFYFNTVAQNTNRTDFITSIVYNDVGTALTVRCRITSININGVTIARPIMEFFNATTGAAFALSTATIAAGKQLQIAFTGKLA